MLPRGRLEMCGHISDGHAWGKDDGHLVGRGPEMLLNFLQDAERLPLSKELFGSKWKCLKVENLGGEAPSQEPKLCAG